MAPPIQLRDLAAMSIPALDELYATTPLGDLPQGRFDGHVLTRLDTRGAHRAVHRITQAIGFEWVPWGVDFDRTRWFFVHPRARLGHFTAAAEHSRWRDAETFALRYAISRIPGAGWALYDEVKPLSDSLCLGIGGVNAGVGEGDHFFFALTRRP